MKYILVLRTMTSGVPWRLDFEMASNTMAIEYVQRILAQRSSVPWSATGADLFSAPTGYNEQHVASFSISEQPNIVKRI